MAPGRSWKLAPSRIVLLGKLKDNCSTAITFTRSRKTPRLSPRTSLISRPSPSCGLFLPSGGAGSGYRGGPRLVLRLIVYRSHLAPAIGTYRSLLAAHSSQLLGGRRVPKVSTPIPTFPLPRGTVSNYFFNRHGIKIQGDTRALSWNLVRRGSTCVYTYGPRQGEFYRFPPLHGYSMGRELG